MSQESNKSVIIGLTGHAKVGKDTAANAIMSRIVANNSFGGSYTQVSKMAFADPIREIGRLFGFTFNQMTDQDLKETFVHPLWNVTPRRFMQLVGSEMFRNNLDKDVWVKYTMSRIKELSGNGEGIGGSYQCMLGETTTLKRPTNIFIISDVRFPNEVKAIEDAGGCIVKINRPEIESQHPEWANHDSESYIESIDPDLGLVNDGMTLEQFQAYTVDHVQSLLATKYGLSL